MHHSPILPLDIHVEYLHFTDDIRKCMRKYLVAESEYHKETSSRGTTSLGLGSCMAHRVTAMGADCSFFKKMKINVKEREKWEIFTGNLQHTVTQLQIWLYQ